MLRDLSSDRRAGVAAAWVASGAIALLAGGCTVGPEYERPEVVSPDSFRTPAGDAIDAVDVAWWSGYEDEVLDALIEEALASNPDLRVAVARVAEFSARIGITRSAAFPQVSYNGDGGRSQGSRETDTYVPGSSRIIDFYEANLSVGWELDVFGRVRSATDAAIADTLAAEEGRRGVVLTLVTSVATSYITLLSLDEQLAIAERVLESRRETARLFQLRYDKGIISQLELSQIRSELESAAATIPVLQRDIARVENALSVLLGRPPGDIERGAVLTGLSQPVVPAGLPSDLLRRRPDLRGAEQSMIAANERVGVAVASFYPSFNLTASLGVASGDLDDLFDSSASTYSLAAGIAGPLFTSGFLENQLAVAEAQELQAIEAYRGAVLTALREADDALITRTTSVDEFDALTRQVEELSRYAVLAQERYDNGFVAYIEVLDAERTLFDAELQKTQRQAALLASYIGIYKAFGGGWVEIAESIADGVEADPGEGAEGDATDDGASG